MPRDSRLPNIQTLAGLNDPKPTSSFQPFSGPGHTLGGRTVAAETAEQQPSKTTVSPTRQASQGLGKKPPKAAGFDKIFKKKLGDLLQQGNAARAEVLKTPVSVMPEVTPSSVKSGSSTAVTLSTQTTAPGKKEKSRFHPFADLKKFFAEKPPSAAEQLQARAEKQRRAFERQQEPKKAFFPLVNEAFSLAYQYFQQGTKSSAAKTPISAQSALEVDDPAVVARIQEKLLQLHPEAVKSSASHVKVLVEESAAPDSPVNAQAQLFMILCMIIKAQLEAGLDVQDIQVCLLQFVELLEQTGMLGQQRSPQATQAQGTGQPPSIVINQMINHETTVVGDNNNVCSTQELIGKKRTGDFSFGVNAPSSIADKQLGSSTRADFRVPKGPQTKP